MDSNVDISGIPYSAFKKSEAGEVEWTKQLTEYFQYRMALLLYFQRQAKSQKVLRIPELPFRRIIMDF